MRRKVRRGRRKWECDRIMGRYVGWVVDEVEWGGGRGRNGRKLEGSNRRNIPGDAGNER